MNVLSLCDGMSCLQIAMKESGMKVDKYYASEIDKHAMKQTQLNFPNTIQLGSITDVDVSKLDRIDFIGGGTPCTNFSFAGKRQGMSTTSNEEICTIERYLELKEQGFEFEGASYLFWEYMRILRDVQKYNPDVIFLLENVEMGKKWERVLSEAVGVYGVHINSALVSAQNRKRIYWTNIQTKQVGLFGEVHSYIPQPKDKGILLRDILEDEVDEKYYLSDRIIKGFNNKKGFKGAFRPIDKNVSKSGCVTTRTGADCATETFININRQGAIKSDQNKASCFTSGAHSGGNHSDMDLIVHNMMLRSSKSGKGGTGHLSRNNDKCYCLDTGQTNAIERDNRIRRLTPTECSRLQTIPEWYKWECSDTQMYKMLGNGWTIDVITHILKFMSYG